MRRSTPELMREAGELYDRGAFAAASRRYEEVIARSAAIDIHARALFGAGLAYEGQRDFERASERYGRLSALLTDPPRDWSPPRRLTLDTLFRHAYCVSELTTGAPAVAAWTRVLRLDLTAPDRAEALLRRGLAHEASDALDDAERDYEAVLALYRRHPDHPRLRSGATVSRAQFQIGELYRARFGRIQFRLPLERMARALEEKTTLFLKAQKAFMGAVRLPNAHWALAAGQRLGLLFEEMYHDMLEAEVPADFDAETRAVYEAEMKRLIRPHIERAVELYETNLAIARELGHQGEWVRKTREGLVRLRDLLEEGE